MINWLVAQNLGQQEAWPWMWVLTAGALMAAGLYAARLIWRCRTSCRPGLRAVSTTTIETTDAVNRRIVESAPIVVGVLDRESRSYRFFSPYVKEVLGYIPEELLEMGPAVFATVLDPGSEANLTAHFGSLDEGPDSLIAEILLKARRRNGTRCWLLCRDRALQRSSDGKVATVLSMGTDVTLLMETRRRIIESRNQAQAASRAKDEFMTLISHELHTPLNAVFGGLQLLQQEEMTAAQRDCCSFIQEGADSLQKLFSNLLEYSQAQSETAPGMGEDIQIRDELEVLHVRGLELASDHNLIWRMEVAEDVPPVVQGDRNRLVTVVRHLIENATKFTPEGEASCSVRVHRRTEHQVWLEIVVSDTGIGMSEEERERIFDPFQQAESTNTRRFDGTGIGLTIVRRHLEAMKGSIETESQPGKGSRFRLIIPFDLP